MTSGATSTSFGTANLEQTPAFTHDDENRERTTLTVQEILSIESDLHGITAGVAGLSVGGPLPSSSCSDANTYGEQSHKQDVSSILADEHTSPEVRAQLTAASASSIRALDDALAHLPQPQTLAYYEALLRCSNEITPEIKLQFLQREDFNAAVLIARQRGEINIEIMNLFKRFNKGRYTLIYQVAHGSVKKSITFFLFSNIESLDK